MYFIFFPGGSEVEASACNVGDLGSITGSGIFPEEGNGNPFQYSCLGSLMDREVCRATVHGIAKSQTQLSNFTFTFKILKINRIGEGVIFIFIGLGKY